MDDFDSATYSIESEPDRKRIPLDDVILPTVRRSAIQIVTLSPRRQAKRSMPLTGDMDGTMQVTKLVLKTPPGSPKRQPKAPGVLVKSIQTIAGPGLTGVTTQHGTTVAAKVNNILTEKRNLPLPVADDHTGAPYRIIPIHRSPQHKDSKSEFEARRSEREHATHEFQDFLRESFKENKTPPPSTPPLPAVPSSSSAIEVTRLVESTGPSDTESAPRGGIQSKSTGKTGISKLESCMIAPREQMKPIDVESQHAGQEKEVHVAAPTPAARRSLLMETAILPPTTVHTSNEQTAIESIKSMPVGAKTVTTSIKHSPEVKQESHETVETAAKATRSNPVRPKPPTKPTPTKTAPKEEVKKKEKSYDPAKAREFMKEQQAKRRLEKKDAPTSGTASSSKGAAEKDLIKKRLETLRQSSQKLVSKNLQKARKRSVSCTPNGGSSKPIATSKDKSTASAQSKNRAGAVKPSLGLRKFASTPTLRLVKRENVPNDEKQPILSKKAEPEQPVRSVAEPHSAASRSSDGRGGAKGTTSERSANPSTASSSTTGKASLKIGILRKPDSMALDDIVSPSPLKPLPKTAKVNAQLIVIKADQDEAIEAAEKELKLQVPDVKLVAPNTTAALGVSQDRERPYPVAREEEHPAHDHHAEPVKSIPSWLKQSLRQPDPYPFILAVRKKLEAVQNVREEKDQPVATQEKQKVTQQQLSGTRYNAYLNEIESVPYIRKKATDYPQPTEGIALNKRQSKDTLDGESAIVTKISTCASPNTTSEISSIRSDIALPLPPLFSSTKIEIPPATSAPFYPATASGGPISPLSVDRISQMKIATPGNMSRSSHIDNHTESLESKNEEKAKPQTAAAAFRPEVPTTTLQQLLNDPQPLDRSQRELEYQRLLESFNRSLTHVIEVNQQLYSALKNVPSAPAIPPFPQEVLRIRDEMTQTSLPIPVLPKPAVVATEQLQDNKVSGASTTTASNYSDDFEHQSQTEAPPPVPERSVNDTIAVSSTTTFSSGSSSPASSDSNSGSASSSSSSDSADSNTNNSSSLQSSSASSMDHERIDSPRRAVNHPPANATDDERKAKSNTTTAHSSDFDSRSFSLSDSHNNTMNNQPPQPEEYLPSFEESLRRRQLPPMGHQNDGFEKRSNENEKGLAGGEQNVSQDSSISEQLPPEDREEEQSFSFNHSEKANDLKVNAVPPMVSNLSEDSIKKDLPQVKNDTLPYEENLDATINSDLLAAMFNRTDLEVSILSTTVSETNLSYSSIGMFDQLIQTERSKEDQLVSRVQSKQKALLNRAKGQLAWLELQKQRYREKGMTDQITAVKKKQRAILLRLEKDRAELNRAIKSSTESSRTVTGNHGHVLTSRVMDSKLTSYCSSPVANNSGSLTLRKSSRKVSATVHQQHAPESQHRGITGTATTTTSNSIQIAIRGRELEPNDRLEDILLRREEELRKRKEHVQRLLEWHRKLEREEEELIAVEDRLLAYNSRKLESAGGAQQHTPRKEPSIEARVESIEKSLRVLHSIPPAIVRRAKEERDDGDSSGGKAAEVEEETVLARGSKLNRLWYRLTGVKEQRYEPARNYPVTRPHMEALYEDAKRCVLEGFQRNDVQLREALLEQSIGTSHRGGNETVDSHIESVEENRSHQSSVAGEETVRVVPPQVELVAKEPENDIVAKGMDETVVPEHVETITKEETAMLEQAENISQEDTDAPECDLPPMEEDAGKCLLSSTVNGWSPPASRRSIESVEFHTLEETPTQHYQSALENETATERDRAGEEETVKSDSYSTSFEEQPHEGTDEADVSAAVAEESQQLIEDMSLPPMLLLLNNTTEQLEIDDEDGSATSSSSSSSSSSSTTSSCESSATVELSVPLAVEEKLPDGVATSEEHDLEMSDATSISIAQSLEDVSDSGSVTNTTTPTTVTPTMAIEIVEKEAGSDKNQLEPEDERSNELKTEVTPSKEDVPANQPPPTSESDYEDEEFHTKSSSGQGGTTSELAKRLATLHDELEELSETFERTPLMKSPLMATPPQALPDHPVEDQNSSEETITFDYDEDGITPPSEEPVKGEEEEQSSTSEPKEEEDQAASKIEVKLRSKTVGSDDTIVIASGTTSYSRDDHTESIATPPPAPPSPSIGVRMPDIINEAEVLRRQQLQIEQEIKELEQQVGFFREIPNKPPPPYIPPANGSPLALLFPPDARIDELIDGRVEQLHRDRVAPESLRSDHVTNVYEKLILDMCVEFYRDLRPAEPTVSFRTIAHDKRPLVFHNPPDALGCMKDYIRAKIRRVLSDAQLTLQQQQQQHQQHQLLLHHQLQQQQPAHSQLHHHHHHLLHHGGHCAATASLPFLYGNGCASKRKPDQVDEILKQETHDDDARWTNFDREEIEVKDRITDELLKSLLLEALKDMGEAYGGKLKRDRLAKRQESAM
uniref:Centrosome-associated protein 350 n=1 Tax=Anopheles gambiae TaxID=7165 RepID=A0A1S4H001_ANOGA